MYSFSDIFGIPLTSHPTPDPVFVCTQLFVVHVRIADLFLCALPTAMPLATGDSVAMNYFPFPLRQATPQNS